MQAGHIDVPIRQTIEECNLPTVDSGCLTGRLGHIVERIAISYSKMCPLLGRRIRLLAMIAAIKSTYQTILAAILTIRSHSSVF